MPPNDKTQRSGGTAVPMGTGAGKQGGVAVVTTNKPTAGTVPAMATPPTGNTKPKSSRPFSGRPDGG
jgi:hypothetical protein